MNDLMAKLAISKKIMDKHNEIPRANDNVVRNATPQVESYSPVQANYNIPNEFIDEQSLTQNKEKNTSQGMPDRIMNSKLPDEIKKLMIENPIEQPKMAQTSDFLSEEIIEGAQKLMGTSSKKQPQGQSQGQNVPGIDMNMLKTMIRDTVRDTVRDVVREELSKSGILTESETKTNDSLQLKVGKHIFEGKVTKIKKIQ